MLTSNFARAKRIPDGLRPVGIAVKPPWYYQGEHEPRLAPRSDMLHMSKDEYIAAFDAILAGLDPQELYESLGAEAVLLCWESPKVFCHRRRVAEWFEENLGVAVPEMGFEGVDYPRYVEMEFKPTGKPKKKRAASKPLFGLDRSGATS